MNTFQRCVLYCLIAAMFSMFLLAEAGAVGCNTTLYTPSNVSNWWNSTYTFSFITNSSITPIYCNLLINGTRYGYTYPTNNTLSYITANATISQGNHSWVVTCTDGVYENTSAPFLFYVKTLCDGAMDPVTGRPSGHYCNYTSYAQTSGGATDKMDVLNSTHFVFADNTGMGVRLLTTGASGGGCAAASSLRGLNCEYGSTYCYYSTTTDLRKINMVSCTSTTYPPSTYTLTGGLGNFGEEYFPVVATIGGNTQLSLLYFNGVNTTLSGYSNYPASGVTTVSMKGPFESAAGYYLMEVGYDALGNATDGCKQIFIDEYPSMANGTSSFYVCSPTQGFSKDFFVHNGVLYGLQSGFVSLYNLSVTSTFAPTFTCSPNTICGYMKDCATQQPLEGVTIQAWQHNASSEYTASDTSNASGWFEVTSLDSNITTQILYSKDGYESITAETVLPVSPGFDASDCLILQGIGPASIETNWKVYGNSTNISDSLYSYSDWKPNVTYMKDSLLYEVPVFVLDSSSNEPLKALDLNSSVITTSCSYAITPTAYAFSETGEGHYKLLALISGSWTDKLFAYCGSGGYFDINYLAAGINAKGRIDFTGYKMRWSGLQLLANAENNYTWALAQALFFYDTGENKNIPMANLSCTFQLIQADTVNVSGPVTANISDNKAFYNFSVFALSPTPSPVFLQADCASPGFDAFSERVILYAQTDILDSARCWIADASGKELVYVKIGSAIQHWCAFKTYMNASLLALNFRATDFATFKDRNFQYAYDQDSTYYFSTGVFSDDTPKGLTKWSVVFLNTFTGTKDPYLSYYEFVKVYTAPPSKISPDFCNNVNCPKTLYKGQDYVCAVQTRFETDYTNIIAGIRLNGTGNIITLEPTDKVIDASKNIHETSIMIPNVGEKDSYGINPATQIQCHFELYIDAERLVYGETSTQMLSTYRNEYPTDPGGFQKAWNEFASSSDKVGFVINRFLAIPGGIMAAIQVTNADGSINPLLAVLYMIGFALLIALAIVFMNSRQQGGNFYGHQHQGGKWR